MVSRQRLWQIKKIKLGLCGTCGKNKISSNERCKSCFKSKSNYYKEYYKKNKKKIDAQIKKWREEHPNYQKEIYAKKVLTKKK